MRENVLVACWFHPVSSAYLVHRPCPSASQRFRQTTKTLFPPFWLKMHRQSLLPPEMQKLITKYTKCLSLTIIAMKCLWDTGRGPFSERRCECASLNSTPYFGKNCRVEIRSSVANWLFSALKPIVVFVTLLITLWPMTNLNLKTKLNEWVS